MNLGGRIEEDRGTETQSSVSERGSTGGPRPSEGGISKREVGLEIDAYREAAKARRPAPSGIARILSMPTADAAIIRVLSTVRIQQQWRLALPVIRLASNPTIRPEPHRDPPQSVS